MIIIPTLVAFVVGIFVGWLLWKRHRANVSSVHWNATVDRAEGSERLMDMLTDERENLQSRVQYLDGELNGSRTQLAQSQRNFNDASSRLAAAMTDRSDDRDRVAGLEKDLSAEKAKGVELVAEVETGQSQIGELEVELSEVSGRVIGLEADLARANNQTGDLESKLARANDRAQGLEGNLSDANSRVEGLEGNLSRAQSEIQGLRTVAVDLVAARKNVEELNSKVGQLEAELAKDCGHASIISRLEQQLADQKASNPATRWQQGTTTLGTPGADHTDDLKRIHGIGPKMEQLLNGFGITTWEQLAYLTPAEVATVDGAMQEFTGRIDRDGWVSQAQAFLAAGHEPVERRRAASRPSWRKGTTRLGTPGVMHTDDLKVIRGVGPKMESILNQLGITAWEQLAAFSKADIELVTEGLETFPDRLERGEWVAQAKELIKRFPDPKERPTRVTFLNHRVA